MGFLDFLSGGSEIGEAKGFDINKSDFEIKDADKLFGQTQEQYQRAAGQQQGLQQKQESFLNALQGSAMGTAPSIAAAQMRQAQDRNLAQQMAATQAFRGPATAATQRQVARQAAEGSQQIAQAGGVAALQEQMQNRGLYQQALGQQSQQVNQLTQQYLQMGMGLRQAQEAALANYNQLQVQQTLGINQINAENQRARASAQGNLVGGILSAGAAIGSAGMTSAAKGGQQQMAAMQAGGGGGGGSYLGGAGYAQQLGSGMYMTPEDRGFGSSFGSGGGMSQPAQSPYQNIQFGKPVQGI